MNIGTGMKTQ